MPINSAGNRVSVSGDLRGSNDLRLVAANLHQVIEERGYPEVVLDFERCTTAFQAVMLPLMPILALHRERRQVSFRLVEPMSAQLRRLFINANWAHFIDPGKYAFNQQFSDQVPAQRFRDHREMDAIIEQVLHLLVARLDISRTALAALEWSMNEIMDNVLSHAEAPSGGFVQATAFERAQRVEFVVADAGIGIPGSIRVRSDEDAIVQAVEEGKTRDTSQNAGNGLYGSFRLATLSGGEFEINSARGLLYGSERGAAMYKTRYRRIPYTGTAVRCGIGVSDPDLLASALNFRGALHTPLFDYTERRFESEGGEMILSVKDEISQELGSRAGGRLVARMVRNLLGDDQVVVLDFADVSVISSSFADEVLGRLFVDLGPMTFANRIEIRNANPNIRGLIDRAIVQRTRLGNGGV